MSGYANWADEPSIWAKVNALGGTFDHGNPYDAGYDAALADALALIEADPLTNAARDLLAVGQKLIAISNDFGAIDWNDDVHVLDELRAVIAHAAVR